MRSFGWLLVVLICASSYAVPPQDEPIVKAVDKVRPAVVNIYTEGVVTQEVRDPRDIFFERYFGGGMSRGNRILQTPVRNLGSGLIVSPDGYIVTNQHVANREANPKIRVTLVNSARLNGHDPLIWSPKNGHHKVYYFLTLWRSYEEV
ncbi:MAG: hypothetical protein EBS53_16425, partial [Bacteroidetes bacterium]|nr:hypothetical protein [Bacteroidota bacterium]